MATPRPADPKTDFFVRFWGVRGSIACPGPDYAKYGGNTSCLEVRCSGRLLIFDCGTGLRPLGNRLVADKRPIDADVFLTHTHIDHINGLPFFKPAFDARNRFIISAGHLDEAQGIRSVLGQMMAAPIFPIPLDVFAANITFRDFECGDVLTPRPGITIRTAPLNHPNAATAYRIEYGDKSIAYVTDTEHHIGEPDRAILTLIEGADIFIYDATYTDREYPRYTGWGHSTVEEGVRLANVAGVGTYVPFHHDPGHDDVCMDEIAMAAEKVRPGTIVAREGMVLTP